MQVVTFGFVLMFDIHAFILRANRALTTYKASLLIKTLLCPRPFQRSRPRVGGNGRESRPAAVDCKPWSAQLPPAEFEKGPRQVSTQSTQSMQRCIIRMDQHLTDRRLSPRQFQEERGRGAATKLDKGDKPKAKKDRTDEGYTWKLGRSKRLVERHRQRKRQRRKQGEGHGRLGEGRRIDL